MFTHQDAQLVDFRTEGYRQGCSLFLTLELRRLPLGRGLIKPDFTFQRRQESARRFKEEGGWRRIRGMRLEDSYKFMSVPLSLFPSITSGSDMIERTLELNSYGSGHATKYSPKNASFLDLTLVLYPLV